MPHSQSPPNGPIGSWNGAEPAEFRIEVEQEREVVRVCPIGDVDLGTVEELRAQIEELKTAGVTRMILDLRGATFLDSTGLRLVIDVHTTSTHNGHEFAIFPGPPAVQRVFEVTRVSSHLPFADPSSQNGRGGANA